MRKVMAVQSNSMSFAKDGRLPEWAVAQLRETRDRERLAAAGEVAAGLAHEIRNPLATAKAALQLYEVVGDEGKRRELLAKLANELDRMNEILTAYVTFSRPEQADTARTVNVTQVLREIEPLLLGEAHFHGIGLVVKTPVAEIPSVTGSTGELKQVFLDLARNAVEAMERGGRLEISVYRDGDQVKTLFQDNGPGIPEEKLEKVTRPFFTTKPGRAGLGLSIATSMARTMGGALQIKSSRGGGTAVEVCLPLAPAGSV